MKCQSLEKVCRLLRHLFPAMTVGSLAFFLHCDVDKGTFPQTLVNITPPVDAPIWKSVKTFYFLPENQYLWVGTNNQVRVVEQTGQVIREFSIQPNNPNSKWLVSALLSKDSKTLIATFQISTTCTYNSSEFCTSHENVAGWDLGSGTKQFERWSSDYSGSFSPSFSISVDGSTMAISSAADSLARVVDTITGQELFQIPKAFEVKFLDNQSSYDESRYLPNNNRYLWVSFVDDSPDQIWDIRTKSKLAELPARVTNVVRSISLDGTLALLDQPLMEPTAYRLAASTLVWDLKTSQPVHTLTVDGEVNSATLIQVGSFSSDASRVLTFGGNWDTDHFTSAHLHVWDTATGKLLQTIEPPWNHQNLHGIPNIASFWPTRSNLIWTSSEAQYIRSWNVDSGRLLNTFLVHEEFDFSISSEVFSSLHPPRFSQDGTQMMTNTEDPNLLVVWDLSGI